MGKPKTDTSPADLVADATQPAGVQSFEAGPAETAIADLAVLDAGADAVAETPADPGSSEVSEQPGADDVAALPATAPDGLPMMDSAPPADPSPEAAVPVADKTPDPVPAAKPARQRIVYAAAPLDYDRVRYLADQIQLRNHDGLRAEFVREMMTLHGLVLNSNADGHCVDMAGIATDPAPTVATALDIWGNAARRALLGDVA